MIVSLCLGDNFYMVWRENSIFCLWELTSLTPTPIFSNSTPYSVIQAWQMWRGDPGMINIIYCWYFFWSIVAEMRGIRPYLERGNWSLWFPLSSIYLISALLVLGNSVIGLTMLVSSTNSYQMNVQDFVLGMSWRGAGGVGGRASWAKRNKN